MSRIWKIYLNAKILFTTLDKAFMIYQQPRYIHRLSPESKQHCDDPRLDLPPFIFVSSLTSICRFVSHSSSRLFDSAFLYVVSGDNNSIWVRLPDERLSQTWHPQINQMFSFSPSYTKNFSMKFIPYCSVAIELCNVKRAKKSTAAIRVISECDFKAIIITHEGLTNLQNRKVLAKVKDYIENSGLAIVDLHFPNFTTAPQFDNFSKAFDITWRRGAYHRSTFGFVYTSTIPTSLKRSSLPRSYSMKVLHVKDARPHEKIFVPFPGAMT